MSLKISVAAPGDECCPYGYDENGDCETTATWPVSHTDCGASECCGIIEADASVADNQAPAGQSDACNYSYNTTYVDVTNQYYYTFSCYKDDAIT